MRKLRGVVVPPPTPLDPEGARLDVTAIRPMVEYLVAGGVHGVFVNGTTGEGALLSIDERERTTAAFAEAAAGRLAVIVQVGDASTAVSARLARHAASFGADGVAVVAPYYFEHDQAALERHVRAVAEACDVPTFLYDIPQRTSNGYGLEITRRLYADGVVVGSKDSSGNLPKMLDLLDLDGFTLLTGADHLALTTLQAGAAGMVTGPGGVFPEPYVKLFDSIVADDLAEAARWQRVVVRTTRALGYGGDLPLLKAALGLVVDGIGAPRPPHTSTPPERLRRVAAALADIARDAGLTDAGERFARHQ
ncbi:MAG: dihydrodipicolinate synthase family protein [Trueperaceae bacterium]